MRIRAANGIVVHKQVMRNDIKIAAKIIQILDKKYALWEDPGEEKKDEEKEVSIVIVSMSGFVMLGESWFSISNLSDELVEEICQLCEYTCMK